MDLTNLHWLSASDAARLIRDGVVGSAELVQACLARVRETDAQVQAWAFLDPDHALAQARAADELRLSGQPVGLLHGGRGGIKDIIDTADMPTENGSVLCAGRTPSRDASVVAMLRAAGAVIMGKTVTTEFAVRAPGKTRNPHNPAHTPGGSSSGSTAAVATGMVPVALGSQTGGSTIRPASFCGVYGLKPTHGLVPRHGMFRLSRTLDHVGLFARSIEDLALLMELVVGYDERDPDSRPRARVPYRDVAAEEPPLPPMFAFVRTARWDGVDADAKEAFAELTGHLGERVETLELSDAAEEASEWHRVIMEAEMAANLSREWETGRSRLSESLCARLERGRDVRALDYLRALTRIPELHASFAELFAQRYDAIVTPTAAGTAPEGLGSTGDPAFCTLWTLCGMPALSVPLMRGANGLPLGVQLVRRRHGRRESDQRGRAGCRARGGGGAHRLPRLVRPRPQGPRPVPAPDPGAHGGAAGRPGAAGDPRERQAVRGGEEGGPVLAGILRLVRRGGSADDGRVDSLAPAREAVLGVPPAGRAGRRGDPVELPGDDGHAQYRARSGGGMHRRPQAGVGHAADRAGDREGRRRRRAARRRVQRADDQPAGPGRRGAAHPPPHPDARLRR